MLGYNDGQHCHRSTCIQLAATYTQQLYTGLRRSICKQIAHSLRRPAPTCWTPAICIHLLDSGDLYALAAMYTPATNWALARSVGAVPTCSPAIRAPVTCAPTTSFVLLRRSRRSALKTICAQDDMRSRRSVLKTICFGDFDVQLRRSAFAICYGDCRSASAIAVPLR